MGFYSKRFRKANYCAAFARSAVRSEFRPRDARALDQVDFVDRRPCDRPVFAGDVIIKVAGDAGRAALDHWLERAAVTTGAEQDEAMRIAREIAFMLDTRWADLVSEDAP